ncbi:MAG: VIT1/CCC1 transporter family protein [Sulfobacillus sp.]|nr:VIT1/CCC1 transporter family protein [Sulfobacillus sp.]
MAKASAANATTPSASDASRRTHSGLVREAIFGINDGLVATIGLVSGEALSHQSHQAVLIAAMSAVGAAVVSMAVGSYLATVSANDFLKKEIRDQKRAIWRHPERERRHVRRLLDEIGVPNPVKPPVERHIVSSRPRWVRFMVRENLGIHARHQENPWQNAVTMGIAVTIGSTPPVLPYLLTLPPIWARDLSWAFSLAFALVLGAVKGRITESSPIRSALSFGFLVTLSAGVGALIGLGLGQMGL